MISCVYEFLNVPVCLSRTNTDTVWKKGVINRLINTASADNCLEAFNTHHKNRVLGA